MAVSNLVTTAGITTSDLVTQPEWTLLNSFTSNVGVTTTTFSSIPQTYRSLRLYFNILDFSSNDQIIIRPNNSSSNIYVQMSKYESSGIINRIIDSNWNYWKLPQVNTNTSKVNGVVDIENYASTTQYKFMKFRDYIFGTTHFAETGDGFWNSTSAITSITISSAAGSGAFSNSNNYSGVGIFLYGAK